MSWIEFRSKCPACPSQPKRHWTHRKCNSFEEISDTGSIWCKGCKKIIGKVWDLYYNCGRHGNDNYLKVDEENLTASLMMMASVSDNAALFAKNILTAYLERNK